MKEKNKIKAHRYKERGKKYKGIDMHSRRQRYLERERVEEERDLSQNGRERDNTGKDEIYKES